MTKSIFIALLILFHATHSLAVEKPKSFESLIRLMLQQDVNAFLILENKSTGKYFQFHKVDSKRFEVDLPLLSLDKDAINRADIVFKKVGIKKQQVKSKDPKTNAEFNFDTYRGIFTIDDIKKVEKLTSDVFTKIHLNSKNNYVPLLGWEDGN